MHQPVLTVVMVPVGALIARADNPFRDESVSPSACRDGHTGKDSARHGRYGYPAHAEGAVRVQLGSGRRLPAGSGVRDINAGLHIIIEQLAIYLFIMRLLNTNH